MCGLCGTLGQPEHWSDETPIGSGSLRRHRLRRLQLLNRVLAPHGLKATDTSNGTFMLQGRTGRTALVRDLSGLWRAAEMISGRAPDPLDPNFISAFGPDKENRS